MTEPELLKRIMAWRKANPDRVKEHKRRYYQLHKLEYAQWKRDNPDKVRASYNRHAVKRRAKIREWQKSHWTKVQELRRRSERRRREELSDGYLRKLIARHYSWPTARMAPTTFLDATRTLIRLKRLCQNHPTS